MTIGRFPKSKLSLPKPNIARFRQIAKVQSIIQRKAGLVGEVEVKEEGEGVFNDCFHGGYLISYSNAFF